MRVHPFPFRTRKLSSFLPTILAWRRAGKIGNANTKPDEKSSGFFFCTVEHCPPGGSSGGRLFVILFCIYPCKREHNIDERLEELPVDKM